MLSRCYPSTYSYSYRKVLMKKKPRCPLSFKRHALLGITWAYTWRHRQTFICDQPQENLSFMVPHSTHHSITPWCWSYRLHSATSSLLGIIDNANGVPFRQLQLKVCRKHLYQLCRCIQLGMAACHFREGTKSCNSHMHFKREIAMVMKDNFDTWFPFLIPSLSHYAMRKHG